MNKAMKRLVLQILTILLPALSLSAADSLKTVFPDAYLDTVQISTSKTLNDYTLIGVNYGPTFSTMLFNPSQKQGTLFTPSYFSLTLTRYGKMFGYMPYFGFQTGIAYGHEGFLFKPDSETGVTNTCDGATQMRMDVIEVPFLAQIHADTEFMKLMVNIGIYGGYRTNVKRIGPSLSEEVANNFRDIDIRFDYGLQGGLGIGFIFDPVELHFNALVRYSWSSIYTPDSSPSQYNQYYYRFAYPFDIMITAGIHFQLTKRKGKTNADLRREAKEFVYNNGKTENNTGSDR